MAVQKAFLDHLNGALQGSLGIHMDVTTDPSPVFPLKAVLRSTLMLKNGDAIGIEQGLFLVHRIPCKIPIVPDICPLK